jgi:2-polyprenyl-3-methyl-5-hydroxy-6-metoxy-1,4-benzoquinol methylase
MNQVSNVEFLASVMEAYQSGARAYAEAWTQPHPWLALERQEAAKWIKPGMSLIDIGCGPGRDTKFWSDRGVRVLGIDASSEMIASASATYPHLEFQVGDILSLDEKLPKSFDAAWLAYVILHVPPDLCYEALSDVRNLVRPGGVVFIATTIAPHSQYKSGSIAGLKDVNSVDICTFTYEWSLLDWDKLMKAVQFSEKWSRVFDFQNGKSTVRAAIYSVQ